MEDNCSIISKTLNYLTHDEWRMWMIEIEKEDKGILFFMQRSSYRLMLNCMYVTTHEAFITHQLMFLL